MPLFEFRCQGCGKTFEKLVRSSDHPTELHCLCCGSSEITRLFSAFATSGSSQGSSCSSSAFT